MEAALSPKAVVFDFDGTIIDTETPDYRAWAEVFAEYGVELPMALWTRGVGTSPDAFDVLAYLERCLGRAVDRAAILERRRRRDLELTLAERVRPGVLELLREARRCGVRVGLASSSRRSRVEQHLTRLGIRAEFAVLCTADDVERVKPDPSLYRLACARLQVDAGEALAVEDSPNGALAAVGAGMRCVVVPNPVTRGLTFPQGVPVLDTLAGMALEELWWLAAPDRPG